MDLEKSSSAFHRYSMQWCTNALHLAGKAVPLDELPALDYSTRSKSQPPIVISSPKGKLWDHVLAERYLGFVKQWTLMFVRSIVTFGSLYCVMKLLKSLEDHNNRTYDAWIWLVGIGISSTCQTLINYHLIWIQWSEMGIPIRAQLIMAIFQKALRIKDSKDAKGASNKPEAINLISSDTLSFSKFTAVNYILPASFIRFFFAALFLKRLLGWQSTLVGMVVTVVCVPLHSIIMKQQRVAEKDLTAARDKKTRTITEALHTLRQIKFSALETQWEGHIDTLRREELELLHRRFIAGNKKSVWAVASPLIVAAASICAYAFLGNDISPSIMFPMIEVLPHLQGALGFLPVVLQDYFGARLNTNRMDEYLKRPERVNILDPSRMGGVFFHNAAIAWPSDEVKGDISQEKQASSSHQFSLHGINLEFPVGELSVIYGKTGCGKSLLLSAIIGEVDILSGRANAPSMANGNPVAFISQTPWLQSATVQDNILFGNVYNKERYEKVLHGCALQPDLAALPKGDKTQIGLRGVKLSGGQRARVSFARALYSNAQLLVLDDIFSALDSHVCKEIFNALTGDLGKGRTRILATHHVALCLPKTKYIVHIENNTIRYAGNIDSIEAVVDIIQPEVETGPQQAAEEKPKPHSRAKTPKTRPVSKKISGNARIDFRVYKGYFAAAGGLWFTLIYLLGLLTKQFLTALTTWFLGRINATRREVAIGAPVSNMGRALQQYLYLYLLSSFLAVNSEYFFNLHTSWGSLRASKTLFKHMTSRVLRMPLFWLDTTPMGEILKRFSVDARMVDDSTFDAMSEFADCFVQMMIIVGVG